MAGETMFELAKEETHLPIGGDSHQNLFLGSFLGSVRGHAIRSNWVRAVDRGRGCCEYAEFRGMDTGVARAILDCGPIQ